MIDNGDLTSQTKVEARLKEDGYTEDFRVNEDGKLCSMTGDKSYSVNDVKIVDFYRFEGETNPDDMAIVYALECTDGAKGTISNSYGPYADQYVDAFLKQVEDLGKILE